jgi:hypothetical protein
MVAALTPVHTKAAKGFTKGRGKSPVRLIAVHTAEGSTTVESLGNYFAGTTAGSSHAGIGQGGQYAEFVSYANTAWTDPPVNSVADTVEICGFAKWTRDEWLAKKDMIETIAHWIAWRCSVRGIPVRHITDASGSGVVGHRDINSTYHKSSHTDPGPNFPWDVVIARAQALSGVQAKIVAAPQPKTAMAGKDRWLGVYNPPCRGQDVVGVQHALVVAGNDIPVDGVYKPSDAKLIALFQKNRKIVERGVGPLTWAALRKVVH